MRFDETFVQNLEKQLIKASAEIERQRKRIIEVNGFLHEASAQNTRLREAIKDTIWNYENDFGRAGVDFLKETLAALDETNNESGGQIERD